MATKQPKVTRRKITDYQPDSHNANLGSERGLQMLEASLNEDGAGRSIVVDAKGKIPAGNKTLEAAVLAGIEDVIEIETDGKALIVHKRTDWDLDDPTGAARRYAYRDNRVSEVSLTWDANVIAADVEAGVDLSGMFTQPELEYIGLEFPDDTPPDAGAQIDRADELLQVWQVERGQLWVIPSKSAKGSHRLLCGDSTNADDVARVMGDDKAVLMSTDPPYGVDFEGQKYNPRAKAWDGIEGDKRQGNDLKEWLQNCLSIWIEYITSDAAFYMWTAAMEEGAAAAAIRGVGLHVQSQIIWNKNTLILGQADYQWKHENCWYAFWKGKQHRWFGGRDKTTVWEISKVANSAYLHPMQKPTELYSTPMEYHTKRGEICAEPFAGSGSQYVAGEQLGRLVYGCEFEPKYCAVILQRMSDMGLQPKLAE